MLKLAAVGPRRGGPARNAATTVLAATPTVVYLAETLIAARGVNVAVTVAGGLLAAVCAALIAVPAPGTAAWARPVGALVGCVSIVLLDLGTHNAGVIGQLYFGMPVLYAAVHLRRPGVVAVTAAAVLGEAVVVLAQLRPVEALLNLAFVGSTLVFMAGALARAGAAEDRLVARLRHQAGVDPLTGLVTRRVLDEATEEALATGRGDAGAPGTALVLIDVDWFKEINDTYGHAVGDDALTHIAATLSERCRSVDVVARLGGDELAVLMPGCTQAVASARAMEFADAVRHRPLVLEDRRTVALSVSAGAAHAPSQALTARDLYTTADEALYAVKRARAPR